ncbi:MAG: thiol:disulfide interchange protein DsbA/DsbL [Gammaproteobacteria bacterium]|nr:thiol:disulfide interchange protein DsbA/DsbL [Gammaproteobacteria bacterium]
MKRLLIAATLLALAACGSREPPPAPAAGPAAAPAPPGASTPRAANELAQASTSQESAGNETEHADSGDASLERMAGPAGGTPLPEGKWQAGTDYNVLVPAQPTSSGPGRVEVMEIFWLACPHCYELEPFLQGWLKSKPAWIDFVRVPVIWQPMHRAHARLYYTLDALGRLDLVQKAMDTMVKDRNMMLGESDEDTERLMQKWAVSQGVSAADFANAYNSFTVNANLQRAEELTSRYRVEGVPFVVVNGKYTTDVTHARGESRLIELIGDLTAAEHHR